MLAEKEVFLVESIGDMLALWDCGIKNSLVSFGLDLSVPCLNTLLKVDPTKIYICFNNDANSSGAGNAASQKLKKKLLKYFDPSQVKVCTLEKYNDFGEMPYPEIELFFKSL